MAQSGFKVKVKINKNKSNIERPSDLMRVVE